MDKHFVAYILLSLVFFVIFDAAFITLNLNMFSLQVIDVQRVQIVPRLSGMIGAYIFMVLGLYVFILRQRRPIWEAIVLGLVINGIFESTSYGLFKKWHMKTVVIDTLWGGALFGLTTALIYQLVPK